MSNLSRFLVDLATNPDLKARYTNDPAAVMEAAGLSSQERTALESGDSSLMRAALGKPENECMSQTGDIMLGPGTVITEPDGKVTTLTVTAKLTCDLTAAPSVRRRKAKKAKKAKKGRKARKTAKRGKRR